MNSFWDFFWVVLASFAFGAYLVVLFRIFADLGRDHATSGWVKAVWVFFLFVVPFISALIYLIVRGEGMARRSRAAYARFEHAEDELVERWSRGSRADQIREAKELLDAGLIGEAEFQERKKQALS